jgi:hypothetical protein
MCSELSERYAQVVQQVDSIAGSLPAGVSIVDDLASDVVSKLPTTFPTIPVLNWNVGGMRVPITAEAIVRMQSPVQSTKLP